MKKLSVIFLLFVSNCVYSQINCWDSYLVINFEDTVCLNRLTIDTINYNNNIWQIGKPHKSVFDSLICQTHVIVTDTANPYPVNDTSVFIIKSLVTNGVFYGCRMFSGQYYVQSDSLKDYGKIEFSPDMGTTWIDFLNDTTYSTSVIWYSKPILTGHSHKCLYFDAVLPDWGSVFNLHLDDTMLFKFSFISDSIFDNLGGLMYNSIEFMDFVEGMSEIRFTPIKSLIYPNPVSENFTIEFDNSEGAQFELSIYDIKSKLIYKDENIYTNKITMDAKLFSAGVYVYKITNWKAHKRCWGKIIKGNS